MIRTSSKKGNIYPKTLDKDNKLANVFFKSGPALIFLDIFVSVELDRFYLMFAQGIWSIYMV